MQKTSYQECVRCLATTLGAFALSVFLADTSSFAAAKNFDEAVLGLNIHAGAVIAEPKTNAAEFSNSVDGSWGTQYGGDLSFNFFNKALIRPFAELILMQNIGSVGSRKTDGLPYTQITEGKIVTLGGKLSLIPYMSMSKQTIVFFGAGIAKAELTIVRERTLVGANNAIQEQSIGKETITSGHIGFSTFFTQNWSFEIELGYQKANFSKIIYKSSNDVNDQAAPSGSTAINDQGNPFHYDATGGYANAGIRINF